MLRVGLTGGIGSGKTYVSSIFEKLSVPVFYADIHAKHLLNTDKEIIHSLKELFGNEIYQPNGTVHRKKLAEIIFNDKFALKKVNDLVHPKVRLNFELWAEKQVKPYVIEEAAVLFESGQAKYFDKIITVTATIETRIKRIMQRDHATIDKVMERINNQLPDELKTAESDYIIFNNNGLLLKQILEIHYKLI